MDSAIEETGKETLSVTPKGTEKPEDRKHTKEEPPKSSPPSVAWYLPEQWPNNIRLVPGGQEDITSLSNETALVHVLEQPSRTDFTCLKWKCRAKGMPAPVGIIEKRGGRRGKKTSSFDDESVPRPGFPRAMLLGKRHDVDKLAALIELAREAEYPVVLVPQVVVYERRAARSETPSWWDNLVGPGGKPKMIRKWWTILRSGCRVLISAADKIDIKEFVTRPEVAGLPDTAVARMLLDTLRLTFRQERRVVIGPHVPQRERMKQIIKRHRFLIDKVSQEARKSERSEWEVWKEVDIFLEEIMADYSVNYIRMWEKVLSWVWKRFFGEVVVDRESLERTRRTVRKSPVIYVPCHRSHTDYLLVSYVLFTNDMTPPHIAAGKNLNFWPLGHLFRKSGAFFMRRSFRDTGIYRAVFESYIRCLIREGFNIEFYLEGGRSRTGKMFLPKMGVLGMFIRAFEEGELNDLNFVPISINYDRVPEDFELLQETQATKKEKVKPIKLLREFLGKNFGRIHVNFAHPLSLKEFLAYREVESSAVDVESRRALYRDFAFRVIHSINEAGVITPTAVLSSALLARSAPGVEEDGVIEDALVLEQYLEATGAKLAPSFHNPRAAIVEALKLFQQNHDVKEVPMPEGDQEEMLLDVDPEKRPNLEYYKNGALHGLYQPALLACSLLAAENAWVLRHYIEEDYRMMSRIFKYEFVYDSNWPDFENVSRILKIFENRGYIECEKNESDKDAECWAVTAKGRESLPLFAGLVENFVEAYLFTLEELVKTCGYDEFVRRDCARKLMKTSVKAFHLGRIKRRETISTVTFHNAMNMAAHLGIIEKVENTDGGREKWRISPQSEYLLNVYIDKLERLSKVTLL